MSLTSQFHQGSLTTGTTYRPKLLHIIHGHIHVTSNLCLALFPLSVEVTIWFIARESILLSEFELSVYAPMYNIRPIFLLTRFLSNLLVVGCLYCSLESSGPRENGGLENTFSGKTW